MMIPVTPSPSQRSCVGTGHTKPRCERGVAVSHGDNLGNHAPFHKHDLPRPLTRSERVILTALLDGPADVTRLASLAGAKREGAFDPFSVRNGIYALRSDFAYLFDIVSLTKKQRSAGQPLTYMLADAASVVAARRVLAS